MKTLDEPAKTIALTSYAASIRKLFLAGAVLALGMTLVQAGTGWMGYEERSLKKEADASGGNDENDVDSYERRS